MYVHVVMADRLRRTWENCTQESVSMRYTYMYMYCTTVPAGLWCGSVMVCNFQEHDSWCFDYKAGASPVHSQWCVWGWKSKILAVCVALPFIRQYMQPLDYRSLENFHWKTFRFGKSLCLKYFVVDAYPQKFLTTKLFSTLHCLCMGAAQLLDCMTARTTSGRVRKGEFLLRLPFLFVHFYSSIFIRPFGMQRLESKCMCFHVLIDSRNECYWYTVVVVKDGVVVSRILAELHVLSKGINNSWTNFVF